MPSEAVSQSCGPTFDSWYRVIVESPGLSQLNVNSPSPAFADSPVGLAGFGAKGVALKLSEAGPGPLSFTARTRNVYCTLLVRLVAECDVVVASLPEMSFQSSMPNM